MKMKLEMNTLIKWGEDKINDLKRPLYEWYSEYEDEIGVIRIVEDWSNLELAGIDFDESHMDSITLVIDPDYCGIKYFVLRELFDMIDLNSRNITFECLRLGIKSPDGPDGHTLEGIMYEWKEKWRSGKRPFRVKSKFYDGTYHWYRVVPYAHRGRKLSAYQLMDLVDKKLPNTEVVVDTFDLEDE